jgi:putative endonuclease
MEKGGCIYILTNPCKTVLYIGVTSDLYSRITEHKQKKYPNAFTTKYNCNILVYYETFYTIEEAIAREKALKKWNRQWKENLINEQNPIWKDLFEEIKAW